MMVIRNDWCGALIGRLAVVLNDGLWDGGGGENSKGMGWAS